MVTEVDVVMCVTCIYMFESVCVCVLCVCVRVCVCVCVCVCDLELKRDHMLKEHLIRLI